MLSAVIQRPRNPMFALQSGLSDTLNTTIEATKRKISKQMNNWTSVPKLMRINRIKSLPSIRSSQHILKRF